MFLRFWVAAAASLVMIFGALAQDGARAYHLLPAETNILSLTETILHAEVDGSVFDVGVVTPTFRHTIDLFGHSGAVLVGLPIGSLSAALDTQIGTLEVQGDLAPGDLFVGGWIGILGSPSLAPMDYAQHKPGLRVSAAARLFLPTGDYDPDRLLNLGGNRWSLEASLPISYGLGETMIDPQLTTFELQPGVQIFGDNDDPFGATGVTSQDPIWGVEGHVTHNFGSSIWAALDGYYETGGETSADGVANGDGQDAVSLGATLGLTLSSSLALRLSYDQVVHSSEPDSTGRHVEITTAYRF